MRNPKFILISDPLQSALRNAPGQVYSGHYVDGEKV